MSITLRRDPVCSCPITDHRGKRLEANELWLHFLKKTSVTAINITLGVPGQRADKKEGVCFVVKNGFVMSLSCAVFPK
jgi:hypothetical protein